MNDRQKQLVVEIAELENRVGDLVAEAYIKKNELANLACPYKIGQVFERTTSYGFKGKHRTERGVLLKITYYGKEPFYSLHGAKLRKDGSVSDQRIIFYSWLNDWDPVAGEIIKIG